MLSAPVPSPVFGDALADAVDQAFGPIGQEFYESVRRGHVKRHQLSLFRSIIPSAIGEDSQERQLYEDLLFAAGDNRTADEVSRRETLQIVLNVARHLRRIPSAFDVRWLLYAGFDPDHRQFSVSGSLAKQWTRWRVYQANDLLHYAYETLPAYALTVLEAHPTGISAMALINEMVSPLVASQSLLPETWEAFVSLNEPAANAWRSDDDQSELSLTGAAAPNRQRQAPVLPKSAWAALRLIAVVITRSTRDAKAISEEFGSLNPDGFHSLITETRYLASLDNLPFTRAVATLIRDRIIKRHLWVGHRKLHHQGDYTYLFEADEGRLRRRAFSGPVFTSPRLTPAISFLADTHLINHKGVTELGSRLEATA